MKDEDKTKEQLICELDELRRRVRLPADEAADLRTSEERYRQLTEAVPLLIWQSAANDELVECNHRWEEYSGQTASEARGHGWMKAIHPGDLPRLLKEIHAGMASGEMYQCEYRIRRASDGTYRWHLARAVPLKDENGRPIGWFGCTTDIDGQKQAQEALAEREALLLEAQEVAKLGFHVVDLTTGRITTSAILDRIFGIPIDYERTLDKWGNVLHPDDRQEILDYFKAVVGEKKPFDREYRIVRYGDKQVRWVHGLGRLQFNEDGQPISMIGTVQDITERKLAEVALRESEERYRTLAESTTDIIYILDRQGALLYANQAASQCIGIRSEDLVGKRQVDLFPPEMAQAHVEQTKQVLGTGEVLEYDRLFYFGPEAVWLRIHLLPLRDEAGQITSVMGVCHNITDRKRAEETLQRTHDDLEQRVKERTAELTKANEELAIFHKFAEASSQGFGMSDLEGRISYVNPALCRLYGEEKPADLVGVNSIAYYPEEWKEGRREEALSLLERDGCWHGELRILSRQGKLIPTLHHVFLLRDQEGKYVRRGVVATDITERTMAEESLRQSHDELQAIYDGMADGLHLLNLVTRKAVRSNPAMCRMMGYSKEELSSLPQADAHPPDKLPEILERFQAHIEGRAALESDVPMVRKDGTVFYADITTSRIFYDEAPCLMCFFRDTTERRKAQEALERERQSLWRMIQANDHERQLVAYDIHDGLAQYLAGANMQLQVFDALRESNPDEAKKAYDAATQLVRQSHAESRRLISVVRPPVIDEIGLETAMAHLVHEQRRHGGSKIEFDSNVQFDRLPLILENGIYRIVQEALTNACKHSKSKKVTVTMTQEGQDVRLEVRDWGVGFNPESVEKGHFGLEGIRQRVRLLGGRLTIESTPGSGTLIQVVVPILEKQNEG